MDVVRTREGAVINDLCKQKLLVESWTCHTISNNIFINAKLLALSLAKSPLLIFSH